MIGIADIHAAFDAVPDMPTTEALKAVGFDGDAVVAYAYGLFAQDPGQEITREGAFCSGLLLGVVAERQGRGESGQADPRDTDTARIGCPLCLDRIEPGEDVATLHDHPEARMHAECLNEYGVTRARAIIHQERPNQ